MASMHIWMPPLLMISSPVFDIEAASRSSKADDLFDSLVNALLTI
jgi:hypothetical protein